MLTSSELKKESPTSSSSTKKNVLVVDDDDMTRFVIQDRLTREGFSVSTAQDGKEAIEMLLKNDVSLIILDVVMPRLSGLQFMKLLRNKYASVGTFIPVIIISSYSSEQLREDGFEIAGYSFMSKPLQMDDLVLWVKHLLAFGES
jgi:DNA-binding response OmpR family regulator